MQCLILAGGLGTRLSQLTQNTPKALVKAAGQPFASHQLKYLREQGVTDVVYSIGHFGDQIQTFVGDGSQWDLRVRYIDEGHNLRGTGGALRKAFDAEVLHDYFFVMYGDSFLPIEFKPVYQAGAQSSSVAMMTVLKNHGAWDQSNCHFKDGVVTLYSKHSEVRLKEQFQYIDYGLAVWSKNAVARISSADKTDLADVYQELSEQGLLKGYEVSERFYEVGSIEGLESFEKFVKNKD